MWASALDVFPPGKNAADADRVQHKIVQEAADREQARVATGTGVIPMPLGAFCKKSHR